MSALLLTGAMAAGPATRPAAPVDRQALPAGAVRRLGELRFLVDGLARGPVALSPDGRHAAVADAGGASVWDLATGQRTAVVRPDDAAARDPNMPAAFGVAYVSADTLAVALTDHPIQTGMTRPRTGTASVVLADAATGAVRGRVRLAGSDQVTGGDDWMMNGSTDGPGGLAVSADGRRVAFAAGRRTVLLYDLASGRRVADLGPPPPAVDAPRRPARARVYPASQPAGIGHRPLFSGDGRRLIVTAADGRASVFDADTGRAVDNRRYPADRSASLSGDGSLLATVTADGVPHLFDLSDGHEWDLPPALRAVAPMVWPGMPPATNPSAARPGRRRFYPSVALRTGAIEVAFAPTGGRLAITRVESTAPSTAPVLVPGTAVRIRRSSRLVLVDTAARPPRATATLDLPAEDASPVPVWSADGRVVSGASTVRGVVAFDAGTGRRVSPVVTPGTRLTALAVAPDGSAVAMGDQSGELRVVDAVTNGVIAHRPPDAGSGRFEPIVDLQYTTAAADGQPTLAARWRSGLVHLDPRTLATRRTFGVVADVGFGQGVPFGGGPRPVYAADGRWSAEMDGQSVALVNPATDAITATFAYADANGQRVDEAVGTPASAMFSADSRRLVVRTTGGMQVADVPAGKFGRPVRTNEFSGPMPMAVSPDGAWVATTLGGTLWVYATDAVVDGKGAAAWRTELSRLGSTSAAPTFSDDSAWVVVHTPISGDRFPVQWGVAVYEAATGQHVFDLPVDSFAAVRFAAGRPIAVSSEPNGTVLVWDVRAAIAATGPPPAAARSDANLWADLADPDPGTALRAGFALLDRGRLRQLAGKGAGVAPVVPPTGPSWSQLIVDLSSPDRRTKEAAHKRLEAGGPAAAVEVRRALATHPGGETEARLAAIAQLQTDAGAPATPDAPPPSATPLPNADGVRSRRAAQLLGWSLTTTPPS